MSAGAIPRRQPAFTAQDWDRRYGPREAGGGHEEPNQFVGELTAGLVAGRALDLGVGAGRNAIWLASRGWRVTGVDFSPVALGHVARAATLAGVEVDLVQADLEAYVPPPASFDLVLAVHIHPSAPVRRTTLRRAVEALANDGMLLVVGRDRADFGTGPPGPPDIAQRYSPALLRDVLDGVDLIRCESVPLSGVADVAPRVDTVAWGRRGSVRR